VTTRDTSIGTTISLADVAFFVKKRKEESVKHIIHYEQLTTWFIDDVDAVHYYSVCMYVCVFV